MVEGEKLFHKPYDPVRKEEITVKTTLGQMKESDIDEKKTGTVDNTNENTVWVEYWHQGVLIHRSAKMHLKKAIPSNILQGGANGI